jgi:hypothetical protein
MFDSLKKQSHTILIVILILGITMGIIAVILGLTMKVTGTMIASFVLCFLSIMFIICAGYNLMYHEKTKEHMGRLKAHLGKEVDTKYVDSVLEHLNTNVDVSPYTDRLKTHLSQEVPVPSVVSGSQSENDPDSMRAIGGYFRYGD